MAEEKKPKIDLKARLGNKAAAAVPHAAHGSVPPPAGMPAPVVAPPPAAFAGGIPAPVVAPVSVPPPGGGIPVPPFATSPRGHEPPNPFAPPPQRVAPPPPPRPQDIKVEVGAEAVEAAKQMKKFIVVAGVAGSLAGMLIGYVVGQGSANSKREGQAISGAADLSKDVKASNEKIKALSDKIGEAVKSLKERKFPESFAQELAGLAIPFDGDKLVGRSIGAYDSTTLNGLFQYTADVQALNARKDALKGLFIGQKQKIKDALEAGSKPQIGYTLLVIKGPKGPVGSLAPIQEPFALDADWPKTFKMTNLVSREVQEVSRYDSGDVLSSREKRVGIPIEPQSLGAAFPNDVSNRILSELSKTAELLNGVEGTGDEETRPGLLKTGTKLVESLNKIASKR